VRPSLYRSINATFHNGPLDGYVVSMEVAAVVIVVREHRNGRYVLATPGPRVDRWRPSG
jgi:hypothetical protein